jgi:hypothetical protein
MVAVAPFQIPYVELTLISAVDMYPARRVVPGFSATTVATESFTSANGALRMM